MIAWPDTGLIVDIPGKDRRMIAKTHNTIAHQLITLLAVDRVIDAGALPAIIILIERIGLPLSINHFSVGIFLQKTIIDIKGGKTKKNVDSKRVADIQQTGHFIQFAIKTDPNAD